MGMSLRNKVLAAAGCFVGMVILLVLVCFLLLYREERREGRVPVLMYHSTVEKAGDVDRYAISFEKLDRQLQYLVDEGFTTLTDKDLLEIAAGGKELPAKPVVLTFDDGSMDHYSRVYPLLKEKGMTAVFFVITGRINSGGWLGEKELKEMRQAGMSIQSHSVSAEHLDALGKEKLMENLAMSKFRLESLLGESVTSFCLPGGRYNGEVLKCVRDAGYSLVFTSSAGTTFVGKDMFFVRRLEVRGTVADEGFRALLVPGKAAWKRMFWNCRRVLRFVFD